MNIDIAKQQVNQIIKNTDTKLQAVGWIEEGDLSDLDDAIEDARDKIKSHTTTVVNNLQSLLDSDLSKIKATVNTNAVISNNTFNIISELANTTIKSVENKIDNIYYEVNTFDRKITDSTNTIKAVTHYEANNTNRIIESGLKNTQDYIKSEVDNLNRGVEAGIGSVNTNITKTSNNILDSVKNGIKNTIETVIDTGKGLMEGIKGVYDNIVKGVKDLIDGIGSFFDDLSNNFILLFSSLWDSVQKWIIKQFTVKPEDIVKSVNEAMQVYNQLATSLNGAQNKK